jgi:CheY-like chemotaxis protein
MNAIIGFTKVLQKTPLTEKQAEYLSAIEISGNTLIVLINDILDLAKVDAGMMSFEQTPFKLRAGLSTMLQLVENKIQEKNLELERLYDENIPEVVVGDLVRLNQVILNLLSNAVKFTPEGKITLAVKLLEQDDENVTIEFSVSDTGIGIPSHELQFIFDKFRQASGTARLFGGTGLGLSIVKHLLEAQGGNISVQSEIGKGSTFSFVLTFKQIKEPVLTPSNNDKQDETTIPLENINILVVEDVKLNQLLFKTLLTEFGFNMDLAPNGKIAVDMLEQNHYDIVLMDLHMPEMDGFETTAYIRNQLNLNIPIVALTADVTTADLEKCRSVGMNDYLAKPIDEKLLYNSILKNIRERLVFQEKKTPGKKKKTNNNSSINLDYIRQITRNDNNAMRRIMKAYVEEMRGLSADLKKSIETSDWEVLRISSHSLKSLLGIVGNNDKIKEMTRNMEELARKKENPEKIMGLFREIDAFCSLACSDIQKELDSLQMSHITG